ncbi:MAG TPA: NAD(P)-dependent oxidoreductase [Solirubrobacteraceae bacterium]|nr:NAD(P)-dependent oxidoreductase [Solirubrobacteraceae bacterium]
MRALVVGGAGFVGSHVADALTEAGHETTILDRVDSPWRQAEQEFVAGDLTDADAVAAAVAGHDVVYNFAGIADIDAARSLPVETARVNVLGNVHVLEACARAGVQRYVFASSIYVASEAGSFYRVSKQACELYVEEYQRERGLEYTILRYGTLYGRRATEDNSVHRYLRQALQERRIEASGTGDELREYIHVEDAARLSVQILDPEFANQQVVLTGHHPMRYADVLALIREIVGDDVEIDLHPPAPGESAHYSITPYAFRPKRARKLVSSWYVDMGQGLVDCLEEIAAVAGRDA